MKQDVNMVIKGLDCCLRTGIPNCKECPYTDICYHDEPCKTLLFHASIVIHEQQSEVEHLKADLMKAKSHK